MDFPRRFILNVLLLPAPHLMSYEVAVVPGTAVILVADKWNVGEHLEQTDAHKSRTFNVHLILDETGIDDTQKPRVKDSSSGNT